MITNIYKHKALLGVCLLLVLLLPGSVLAQDANPPLTPTPEPDGAVPEAPGPEMEEGFVQELYTESLPPEFSIMAGGIAQRAADINPSFGSNPSYLQVFNNKLYFAADGGDGAGVELWVYDGSNPPTLAMDINSGGDSSPAYLQVFNNKLYFSADGGDGKGIELWVYDGLHLPWRVADINPSGSSSPAFLQVFNSKLFFRANDGSAGYELWAYDGSNPPTLAADIYSGGSSSPSYLQVFNNQLFFQAIGGASAGGYELWKYDGSSASLAADINPSGNSSPEYLQVFNNQLYFQANSGDAGIELWVYDGSNAPTLAADINPSDGSYPSFLQVYNNQLYFGADGGDGAGQELWVYNGSSASRVADINPAGGSTPVFLQVFNSKLYFNADGGDGAWEELWVYIPTVAKTYSSSATYDGWVLESTRTSSKGGSKNNTATTLSVGDDAQNRQYRSILHFNTATLPDTAVITAVKLQVRRASIKGTNPFNTHGELFVDMRKGAFSNKIALQLTDWQASASKSAVGMIPKASSSGWHTLKLVTANFKYINKKGVSQLRLRFAKQDNGDKGADTVNFYSGNCVAANRPKLVITYYVP